MLNECFIVSSCNAKAAETAGITCSLPSNQPRKDEGIFVHSFRPFQTTPRTAFRKSSALPHCLDFSEEHVYAAQADSGLLHIYDRASGILQTTVPLPGRIECIKYEARSGILAVGLRGGEVLLWETLAGRLTTVPHSHLQKVTTLATTAEYVISGSDDAAIHVWSLLSLLSYASSSIRSGTEAALPHRTLTHHRAPLTALATSPTISVTPRTSITVSCSSDSVVVVWNLETGEPLCTFLVAAPPTCVIIDPAERAAYTAFRDGRIQFLDFMGRDSASSPKNPSNSKQSLTNGVASGLATMKPTQNGYVASKPNFRSILDSQAGGMGNLRQPPTSSIFGLKAENDELGATLSMDLSWDGAVLISSHASGSVVTWDVSKGSCDGVLCKLNGPATNVFFLPPSGFLKGTAESRSANSQAHVAQHAVTKPVRIVETNTSHPQSVAQLFSNQTLYNVSFPSSLHPISSSSHPISFESALESTVLPDSLLEEGIGELAALRDRPAGAKGANATSDISEQDGMILLDANGADDGVGDGSRRPRGSTMAEQNEELRLQVQSLQGSLSTTFEIMKRNGWGRGLDYVGEEKAARATRIEEAFGGSGGDDNMSWDSEGI